MIKNTFLLASFPRSGNTWLRFLIAQAIAKQEISHFNQLHFLIPDSHQIPKSDPPREFHFLKSHLTNFADFAKVLYLLRDPRDVMISYFEYMKDRGQFSGSLQQFVESAISTQTTGCTWEEHVRKARYFQHSDPSRCSVVRYEDLLQNTSSVLAQVVKFLELSITPTEQLTSIQQSTIDRLRTVRTNELLSIPSHRFFRVGQSGQWKTLSTKEQDFLNFHFQGPLQEFGFQ